MEYRKFNNSRTPAPQAYFYPAPVQMQAADTAIPGPALLQFLRRNTGWILLCALAGVILAFIVSRSQTPVFRARSLLEVRPLNDSFVNDGKYETSTVPDHPSTYMETQMHILESNALVGRVAKRLEIARNPAYQYHPGPLARLTGAVPAGNGDEYLLKRLGSSLSVHPWGQSRLLEVTFESKDPQLAADFVRTLGEEFTLESGARRDSAARETNKGLAGQLQDARASLEKSEADLQSYARRAGLLYTGGDKENTAELKLAQVQEALSKAEQDRITEFSRYQRALTSSPDSLPEVLDDESLRGLQARLTDLRRQSAELSTTLEPAHYRTRPASAAPERDRLPRNPRTGASSILDPYAPPSRLEIRITAGALSREASRSATSNPSMPGSWMSTRTISGRSRSTSTIAVSPSAATPTTLYPSASSSADADSRKSA
jgi:uncharacterized protein involved in exopolysaccharide biosynthesis